MTERTFDAFISYSHQDCGVIAPAIQSGIENIGRPWYQIRRRGHIFRDETNLAAAPELWPTIEEALKVSRFFILFASPRAAASKWVRDEIRVWVQKNYTPETGLQNILIVLTDGDIVWSDAANDFNWEKTGVCLPKEVLAGCFRKEPHYVDLRPYVKKEGNSPEVDYKAAGFTTSVTKLIAAIFGGDPRDIESAELRRQRNIWRFLGAVGVVLVSLLTLSTVLYTRESSARKQEMAANEKALAELRALGLEQLNRDVRNGNIYLEANEYCLAAGAYNNADSILRKYPNDPPFETQRPNVREKLDSCCKKCPSAGCR